MGRRKKEKHLDCIAYLSATDGSLYDIEKAESNQEKIIREYALNHNIKIVKVVKRNGCSICGVRKHFDAIVSLIRKKQVDGVILSRTWVLDSEIEVVYGLIGKIKGAGGAFVTTTEGRLGLDLEVKPHGKKSKNIQSI